MLMAWNRLTVGLLLIFAGLAQPISALRAADSGQSWLLTMLPVRDRMLLAATLWAVAMLGFIGAGFGALGIEPFRDRSWRLTLAALIGSVLVLVVFVPANTGIVAAVDIIPLALLLRAAVRSRALAPPDGERQNSDILRTTPVTRRRIDRIVPVAAAMILTYIAIVVLFRPWFIRWGASDSDVVRRLPYDELQSEPAFQETRAITIRASTGAVWPWLAQVGQNRAGFYSYDFLERLVGFGVHNVYRIVPEWQQLAVGDLVRAAPPNYFGGIFGPKFGWRVAVSDPDHELVLVSPVFNWTFFLEPVDQQTTRLVLRLRADASPRPRNYFMVATEVLVLGPAHFIMERRMMLTLQRLAEAAARQGEGGGD